MNFYNPFKFAVYETTDPNGNVCYVIKRKTFPFFSNEYLSCINFSFINQTSYLYAKALRYTKLSDAKIALAKYLNQIKFKRIA